MSVIAKCLMRMTIVVLMACNMSGCGLFNAEPIVDTTKDQQGNQVLADTPRMWRYWKDDVDRAVAKEAAGVPPGGGISSWNAQWLRVIKANRSRQNAYKYINYILEARQRAGLPPLEGNSE